MIAQGGPAPRPPGGWSIAARLVAAACVPLLLAIASAVYLTSYFPDAALLIATVVGLIYLPLASLLVRWQVLPLLAMFRALGGTVYSYQDGDYSFGLHWEHNDEMGELVDAHNLLGDVLRTQRLQLLHRELLLDTMVQNTPVAMLLIDPARRIVLGNIAARKLLGEGKRLEGQA
ncbi:MAG TPA: ATP-binding protein, partial [Burkholderiaceae bacterium]